MTQSTENDPNPFSVTSPEGLSAEQVKSQFVQVFSDFPKVLMPGHSIVLGARGCGKSMMFRYMQPDSQCLSRGLAINKLDFVGIYIPIKNAQPAITEFVRLENTQANYVLNEHALCVLIIHGLFETLKKIAPEYYAYLSVDDFKQFYEEIFLDLLSTAGYDVPEFTIPSGPSILSYIQHMLDISSKIRNDLIGYMSDISLTRSPAVYNGAIFQYLGMVFPFLSDATALLQMGEAPIYLMIDDADKLNLVQTRILNTWISTRTSTKVSIKISVQLKKYKSYKTISGDTIDATHDYHDIDISEKYTSTKALYYRRIKSIVENRLGGSNVNSLPEEYFVRDEEQEARIEKIKQEIKEAWHRKKRGFRPDDDAKRYARPEYIKRLGGHRKSRSSYNYAGFDQLVHLSSGSPRYFLEAAAMMYEESIIAGSQPPITHIPVPIQDAVMRTKADTIMHTDFKKLGKESKIGVPEDKDINRLNNLIRAAGSTFWEILISDRSERRVFSFALTNKIDTEPDIERVLDLGVQEGYLHEATIGNKEGDGRTPLYILTRRIAPYFKLDPTSFAGYLFVTNKALKEAMRTGKYLKMLDKKAEHIGQMILFEEGIK